MRSSNLSHINIYHNPDTLKTSISEILKLYSIQMQPVDQEEFCFIPGKISESVSNIKNVMMSEKYYLPIRRIQTHGFGLSNRSSVAIIG